MSNILLRKFENDSENYHISSDQGLDLRFCGVVKNSNISIVIDSNERAMNLICFLLIPAINDQNVSIDLSANILSDETKIEIYVIALANKDSAIKLNGNLHIDKNVVGVKAKLYEEALLLGKSKFVSMIPWLKVDSPDVIASHWAKVQRISPERLFYMQSRGLDEEKAIKMIIHSYSQQIVDKLQLNEKEKSEFYSMIK